MLIIGFDNSPKIDEKISSRYILMVTGAVLDRISFFGQMHRKCNGTKIDCCRVMPSFLEKSESDKAR